MKINVKRLKENITGYSFMSLFIINFIPLCLTTLIFSIIVSFYSWDGINPMRWVGIENFKNFLYKDPVLTPQFKTALINTFEITFFVVIFVIIIGLLLALVLNNIRLKAFFRVVFILPLVTSGVAIYYAWMLIFDAKGPINSLMATLHLDFLIAKGGWLGQINTVIPSIIIVMVWLLVPWGLIFYLSGLQTIEKELYEAADIDGASAFSRIRYITWPLLKPTTLILIFWLTVFCSFVSYEIVYIMTYGGPAGHSNVVGLMVFTQAFGGAATWKAYLGQAGAIAWFFFLILIGISYLVKKIMKVD